MLKNTKFLLQLVIGILGFLPYCGEMVFLPYCGEIQFELGERGGRAVGAVERMGQWR